MKNIMKRTRIILTLIMMAMLLFVSSCDKEKLENRPDLPPIESILMDFSDFADQPGVAKGVVTTYDNFVHGFNTLAFWQTAATVTLAVPAAAYYNVLTMSTSPEYLGDNRWRWTKEFQVQQVNYQATLTAERISNEEFSMEMKIGLAALPAASVVWFDGVIRYDHTHAEWNLYRNDAGHVKIVEVVWNKDYETGESDLTYTYVEPSQQETGSYITMGIRPDEVYDAYYSVSLSTGMTDIEWDRDTKAGRIKDADYYGDSLWHCWNDLLEDIVCPQ